MSRQGENIVFPFQPRPYQVASFKARANGIKRGLCVWPRRHGKDLHFLTLMAGEALKRKGLYNYYWPTFSLGKKTIWKGMDKEGKPFIDYIPKDLITDKNETELRLELSNGSIIQIIGTDNINQNVVGINPVGCGFSEYPLQNPMAWELTRPILKENGGWAWFLYTPRGRNHGYRLYQTACENPDTWFVSHLNILQTTKADGTPIMTPQDVEDEVKDGMDPDLAQQEYYCSFDAPMQGSYYGRLLSDAFKQERVGFYPYDPRYQVVSGWDIGTEDPTAIWYAQLIGEEIRLIDYYEAVGEDFFHYFKHTMDKPWRNKEVWMPHDVAKTDWGTGKSAEEVAVKAFSEVGVPVRLAPKLDVNESIGVVRRLFPRMTFHDKTVGKAKYRGHSATDCLASYHKKFNEDRQEYEPKPHHNWASHAADALRCLCVGLRDYKVQNVSSYYATAFNPMQDHNDILGEYETNFETEPEGVAVADRW